MSVFFYAPDAGRSLFLPLGNGDRFFSKVLDELRYPLDDWILKLGKLLHWLGLG
jgi:hypothetical protein